MATPTLDAYRQLNPQDTRDESEIVQDLMGRLSAEGTLSQYPDLIRRASEIDREYRLAHRPNPLKELVSSTVGGVDIGQSQLYSAAAQAGDLIGSQKIKDWGLAGFLRNQQESAQNTPTVPTLGDIHGPTDALYYGIGLAGQQLPQIAATTLASAGGGLAATAVAGPEAAPMGAVMGGMGAGYLQMQNYGELATSPNSQDALLTSGLVGAVAGWLQSIVPNRVVRTVFGAASSDVVNMSMQQLLERAEQKVPGLLESIAYHAGKESVSQGLAGTAQALVTMAGEQYANRDNPNFKLTDKEITDRILNNTIGGALLGGVFGSIEGVHGPKNEENIQKAVELRKQELENRSLLAQTNFITPKDPYAGIEAGPEQTEGVTSPVDTYVAQNQNPAYAKYRALFDDLADAETKKKARQAYDEARIQNFYQSDRAAELLKNQLSQEAGGSEIAPTTLKPTGAGTESTSSPVTYQYSYGAPEDGLPQSEYNQIDLFQNGENIRSTNLDQLASEGVHLPPIPQGLPTGQYSLEQIKALHEPGVVQEPSGPMEFGDVKQPFLNERPVVKDNLPELRQEVSWVNSRLTPDEILEAAGNNVRATELGKDSTKRLVAVLDKETGKVSVMPVFRSKNNEYRVDNEVTSKVPSRPALAKALGLSDSDVLRMDKKTDYVERILSEAQEGTKKADTLKSIIDDPKKQVLAFLDTTEPASKTHYTFNSAEEFKDLANYVSSQKVVTKGSAMGGAGVPQVIEHLTKISSEDSRAVQLLASLLESHPVAERIGATQDATGKLHADATRILQKLVNVPRAEVFAERLPKITDPLALLKRGKGGRLFGLFTDDEWKTFKEVLNTPNITSEDLQKAIELKAKEAGWDTFGDFVSSVIPRVGAQESGEALRAEEGDADMGHDDNLSAEAVEQGGLRDLSEKLTQETTPLADAVPTKAEVPDKAKGVVGFSSINALPKLINALTEPDPRIKIEARNILEARADSEISNPKDDFEYQAIREDLVKALQTIFPDVPNLTEDFLYSLYSNLDKRIRESVSNPATYRQVTDTIQRTFHNTVAWLGDRGVDVRLIEKNMDSQVEFIRSDWGRSISEEDGKRMVILSMADITNPSWENLQTLFHEAAHQLIADEPEWKQRLFHDAVDRLTDLRSQVFARTAYDLPTFVKYSTAVKMEEFLAEHLAFQGMDKTEARTWVQKFIGAIGKLIAQTAIFYGKLRGFAVSPELTVAYMELRFQDMLDKVLTPRTNFDTLTGNRRNTAKYTATFYKQVAGGVQPETYDSVAGQMRVHDVIDESTLASQLNLDNKLVFSDLVVRDSRIDEKKKWIWEKFGISDQTKTLAEVLDTILNLKEVDDIELKAAAAVISDRSKLANVASIRLAASEGERAQFTSPDSAGVYLAQSHEILLNPDKMVGFDANDMAYLIAHEAAHAAAVRAMDAYGWYKDHLKESKGNKGEALEDIMSMLRRSKYLSEREDLRSTETQWAQAISKAIPHIQKIEKIFDHLSSQKWNSEAYGMSDLDEFVAESISNRTFQMELAKVRLPDNLRVKTGKESAFKTMVELLSRIFNAGKVGNALESVVGGIEKIMLVADPLSYRNSVYSADPKFSPPVTEAESDLRVKKDFEYEFSALNSQSDFYHGLFDKSAEMAKTGFDKYLRQILGIYNPDTSIQDLELKVGSRSRPIPVNQDLRLNDSKGTANKVESASDRAQLTKRLMETVSDARGKLAAKVIELRGAIPGFEKEHQRVQDRVVRFETMLHDVTSIRDNALKILRKGLRGAERNAERLVQWSARHDGLPGIASELFGIREEEALPEDYAELVVNGVEEHADDLFITDALTAAQRAGIDFDLLSPLAIEGKIQEAARATKDPLLLQLSDESPQAKADLALLIYYAKTAPEDMVALSVRVEKDPERKEAILATIKKIIAGNYEATTGLNDLFKDVRKGDVRVGKARQALTNIMRQLRQTKAQLDMSKLRVTEMEKAGNAIDTAVKPYQAELGLRGIRFEPYDGARILLTNGENISTSALKLGPKSMGEVNRVLMDNLDWLRKHESLKDTTWWAVSDQIEGLKRVAGDHVEREFRNSWWVRVFGSIPERLEAIGIPLLRQTADRYKRDFALRQSIEPIVSDAAAVPEAYKQAMKITGFTDSYTGFKQTFWNPAFHFLRHLTLLSGTTKQENIQYAKEQLRLFFMRNEVTRKIISKEGAFDSIWKSLSTNANISERIAKTSEHWNVMVDDDEIKVQNPRTGKVENARRPAMQVGLMTTQSNITKIFSIKNLLDQVKDPNGEGLWAKWAHTETDVPTEALFTPEVVLHFVKPYIYDTGTLHFNAPALLDGKTKNRANPINVQLAWENADGSVAKFADALFEAEYTLDGEDGVDRNQRKAEFIKDTLSFFRGQYQKIYNMSKAQEEFNNRGLSLMASPMMDPVKAGDFPAEFMDYYVYDPIQARQILSHLAAHSSMGRDLGIFSTAKDPNGGVMWELDKAESELKIKQAEYTRFANEVRTIHPEASVKQIDEEIEKKIGKTDFNKLKNTQKELEELRRVKRETIAYFSSPNGSTQDTRLAQSVVGTLAGGMVNNFKSAINSLYIAFEPLMIYGVGKTGWKQSMRMISETGRSAAGSLVQATMKQASLAGEWDRYMSEVGIGRDPANTVTASQIIADTGKNNVYEDQKLLGWVRKGRSLAFDTGFRSAEGERLAPAFRPQAPFSTMMIAENQGAIKSELMLFNEVLSKAAEVMTNQPGATNDPEFQLTHKDLNFGFNAFDASAFDELKNQFRTMGTTLEIEAREIIKTRKENNPAGNILVSPTLARLIAGEALRRISLPNDISHTPVWTTNSSLGRIAMPLISWSLNKTNQIVGAMREPNGEASRRAVMVGIASLAIGMVPAAVLISMLTDQYDERVLSKKSNLVGFNFDSPAQTATAVMERVGRVGTFGLAGDLVNGVRVYGTSGDLRGISVDQRVVFVNTLMSLMATVNAAYNQEGTVTYDTFYRPLINALGGGGIIQNQQILNNITNSLMGVPVFQAEAETTARINALNYLRGAGRVTGLDVRVSDGGHPVPTPIKPWVSEMVVASYSNNPSEFTEAYQKAVQAARDEGKADPEDYVKKAFEAQHPLRATFATPPSKSEVGRMMSALSDKGREDVTNALQYFNAYGTSLGLKPYDGKADTIVKAKAPSPWDTKQPKNPWQ